MLSVFLTQFYWLCDSYSHLSDIVDHLFPPCEHSCTDDITHASCLPGAGEYSSFTYWRNTLPDVDDELADFIKSRDTAVTDKNTDAKKPGATGKKSTSIPAPTSKHADAKSSAKWTAYDEFICIPLFSLLFVISASCFGHCSRSVVLTLAIRFHFSFVLW